MEIRYGTLLNVNGQRATYAGVTFIPADVHLSGDSFSLDFRLSDQQCEQIPLSVRHAISVGIDAAWVRARIPQVFQFTPPPAKVEKSLLDVGFVAAMADGDVAYPFVCTDHYGKTALVFSDKGPDRATKQSVADAFWDMLFQNPDDLSDFEVRVYHPGASVWLAFGCTVGRLYCDESDD